MISCNSFDVFYEYRLTQLSQGNIKDSTLSDLPTVSKCERRAVKRFEEVAIHKNALNMIER